MVTSLVLALCTLKSGPAPYGDSASCCDPMSPFVSDPAFVASHLPPAPLNFTPQAGKMVHFTTADKKEANGFFVPANKPNEPVLIMVHEWWGLNDYIKREAEMYHFKLGYAVLAVDLYDGKVATTPADAGKYMQGVNPAHATATLDGAVSALKDGAFGTKFTKAGTIGWCFGGGWSHRAAIEGGPFVKACVMYYGMPDTTPADLAKLKAPVLMIWAKKDQWINENVVSGFKSAMNAAHRPLTVVPYDAGHGFANPSNPIYDKAATADAEAKTLAFFKQNL